MATKSTFRLNTMRRSNLIQPTGSAIAPPSMAGAAMGTQRVAPSNWVPKATCADSCHPSETSAESVTSGLIPIRSMRASCRGSRSGFSLISSSPQRDGVAGDLAGSVALPIHVRAQLLGRHLSARGGLDGGDVVQRWLGGATEPMARSLTGNSA